MNSRSTDCKADALTTTPSRRFVLLKFFRKLKLLVNKNEKLLNIEHKSKVWVTEDNFTVFESTHKLYVVVGDKTCSLNQKVSFHVTTKHYERSSLNPEMPSLTLSPSRHAVDKIFDCSVSITAANCKGLVTATARGFHCTQVSDIK